MTRPLPAHGTYARGNGAPGYREPCYCTPCREVVRRGRKGYNVNRQLGRPAIVDAAPARKHLQMLARSMTWAQICAATGCNDDNLRYVADGRRKRIRRSTLEQILAVQVEQPAPGKYIDITGTRRRVQALRAIGWSAQAIAEKCGSARARIDVISSGEQPTIRHQLAEKIAQTFIELHQTPAPAGCSSTVAKKYARLNGWAPPGAWDDIDDPAALPDWTGACGTDRGWWLHSVNNIPVCLGCNAAHQQWKNEHAHLSHSARWAEFSKAKAAVSNRGAAIAHDARELMRVSGLDYEQAAERIGVTRQHLQQELLRHPAPAVEATAA
jgi:DNA-binding Xre family transcriptional regulator